MQPQKEVMDTLEEAPSSERDDDRLARAGSRPRKKANRNRNYLCQLLLVEVGREGGGVVARVTF